MLIEEPGPPPGSSSFYDGDNDCAYFAQYRTPYAHQGYRQHAGHGGKLPPEPLRHCSRSLNAAWFTSSVRELYDKMRRGTRGVHRTDPALREYLDSMRAPL